MLKCSVKRLENHVLGLLGCVEEKMFSKSTRSERDPSNVKILSFTANETSLQSVTVLPIFKFIAAK